MASEAKKNLPDFWSRNPFVDFRREFDSLFDNFLGGRSLGLPKGDLGAGFLQPSVDIKENDKSIVLTAELPGLQEKDVDISVSEGILTVKGEKKMEKKREEDNIHVMERRYGSFQRSISLPDRVDAAKITAGFENGVLTVTMPKKPNGGASARKIAVGRK